MKKIALSVLLFLISNLSCYTQNPSSKHSKIKLLQGIWRVENENIPSFTIDGYKLIYFEHEEEILTYYIKENSLIINYGDLKTINNILLLNGKKMIIKTEDGSINRYHKIRYNNKQLPSE